ncbi:hypothetical protein RHSIM_Rhsim06G0208200 [Rhododendron simsii]|uniref:PARP-type domain-containing protein n=1 Tax=Rhododendron simsii TaxID=118357 RepID=A0A834LKU3_RHOSS|nr:hypothetical protein RHSIM_Rhsim06G0208200 [Rhododendron simsii]
MQVIPNFRILLINPTLSNLFLVCQNPSFFLRLASSVMEPSKVVAEYAKSARSSCKKCDKKIDVNALRLGSVTKDKRRGFDVTKWHHLDCFPMDSESVASAEDIGGFSSLKISDQETLMKLLDESGRPGEKESKDNPGDSDAEDADADDDDDVDDTKDADKATHDDALEHQYHGIVRQSMSSVLRAPVTIMMLLVHQNRYKRKLVTMQGAIGDKDAVKETEERIPKRSKANTSQYQAINNVREKEDDENNDLEDRKSKQGKLSTTTEGAELDVSFSTSDIQLKYKVVAEYAKSARSSCKKCDKKIENGALRLGSVTRDKRRGFDVTKWHHLDCFPMDLESVASVEDIGGFLSLKSSDQESLTKLLDESSCLGEKVRDILILFCIALLHIGEEQLNLMVLLQMKMLLKEPKREFLRDQRQTLVREKDDDENNDVEDRKSKKGKLSTTTEGAELDVSFSTSDIQLKYKVVAEYAKSARSLCKKCDKKIENGAMRLGSVTRDKRRGFDMTKWHHLDCFPMHLESVASAEDIGGFSSLKSSDQESLTKLLDESACLGEKGAIGDKDAVKGTKERIPKRLKVREKDDDKNNDLEDTNSKKGKLSTTTEGAELDVSFSISDIQLKYKDATLLPKWKAFRTVIFLAQDEGLQDSGKIAGFDFDGCLVNTNVKKVGPDAWSLMYPSIPGKLQSLYNEGYKLVIFTNESNIDRWKNKRQVAVDSKIGRLTNFIKHVNVPMQVFIACGIGKSGGQTEDPFRKPNPGMWHLMDWHFNSGISIDMDQSFYVGDAAGRENDHSDADIKFAEAVGLKFYVPEEYFKV